MSALDWAVKNVRAPKVYDWQPLHVQEHEMWAVAGRMVASGDLDIARVLAQDAALLRDAGPTWAERRASADARAEYETRPGTLRPGARWDAATAKLPHPDDQIEGN